MYRLGSTLARLRAPEEEKGEDDYISAIKKRVRNFLQSPYPIYPHFWAAKRLSQTPEEILATLSGTNISVLNLDEERYCLICRKEYALTKLIPGQH